MVEQNDNGLVGKLKDVGVGDRIRIWKETPGDSSYTYEASGYVVNLSDLTVNLSPDHPFKTPIVSTRNAFGSIMFGTKPKKEIEYILSRFDHYAKQVDVNQES